VITVTDTNGITEMRDVNSDGSTVHNEGSE
jgi:hypothetical protein